MKPPKSTFYTSWAITLTIIMVNPFKTQLMVVNKSYFRVLKIHVGQLDLSIIFFIFHLNHNLQFIE